MTNEREKEEAKVTLEELLHQIQVIHLELKIVQNWDYFVFLEMVCWSAGSNVDRLLLADLPNMSWDKTFGIWLDNLLTDCCVIKEAKNLLQAVETLEAVAKSVLAKLADSEQKEQD
ncbi:TPA: hypothetical protein VJY08_000926 [Streptococcus pyogenes]|nr:hypothetical protein [Streptococcus pyogenes]